MFEGGAHDGFHEAIGDTVNLSVTPAYLAKIGLARAAKPSNETVINSQMKMAVDKIAFLPFGKVVDEWRWRVFSGEIKPADYNRTWWELRRKYQGIAPAVARDESQFDPGAKYHVPANTPYTRYFLSFIMQFQFHKALCDAAGWKGPLHECSVFGSKEAGQKFQADAGRRRQPALAGHAGEADRQARDGRRGDHRVLPAADAVAAGEEPRPDLRLGRGRRNLSAAVSAAATDSPQLTLRAAVLGILLALIMAAANTYLGLFAGMTIASAIPSAVISMAVLKALGGGGILEHNIVQTGGSAGSSTATGVIFTAPALVMLGYWSDYRYGWVFAFAALGGVLGVLFTVPLRRALIVEQKLRFPEGTAAAEVLRAGADPAHGARLLAVSAAVGGSMKLLAANGLRLIPDTAAAAGWIGKGLAYLGTNVSPALLGVGYICGVNTGIVIAAGGVIAFNIALPLYAELHARGQRGAEQLRWPASDAADAAGLIWSRQIRYIGVGTMLVGGLWTLFSIRGAMVSSVRAAIAAAQRMRGGGTRGRDRAGPAAEADADRRRAVHDPAVLPLSLGGRQLWISLPMTLAMIVLSFVFCAVSAYMTGLVGGSNDPVSGMIIATILSASGMLLLLGSDQTMGPVAAVMIGATVCCALCLASDNLQDLKCGHLVGATPWRQQFMLALGALTSAFVLAPLLNLLARAYGIGIADAAHPNPLIAPQAVLISSVAKGLFGGVLPWNMVIIGAGAGRGRDRVRRMAAARRQRRARAGAGGRGGRVPAAGCDDADTHRRPAVVAGGAPAAGASGASVRAAKRSR